MLSTSVNVSHILALKVVFFSLSEAPTVHIANLFLQFTFSPISYPFAFCYLLGNVYNSTFQFV